MTLFLRAGYGGWFAFGVAENCDLLVSSVRLCGISLGVAAEGGFGGFLWALLLVVGSHDPAVDGACLLDERPVQRWLVGVRGFAAAAAAAVADAAAVA